MTMTGSSTPASPTVTLRPVTAADRGFLLSVYESTREEELAQVDWPDGAREAFVRMQFDAQDASYRAHNPHGSFDVIAVDGQPAGRLYVDRRPDDIRIVDVALLPEFRGRGVGTHLVTRLTTEASATGRTVSIHVEVHNPAASLYRRLGFVAVAERAVHRRMEWSGSRADGSGEGRLVAHPSSVGPERHQEQDQVLELRMVDRVGALGEDRRRRTEEDQGELQPRLSLGPGASGLGALGRLDQLQRDAHAVPRDGDEALPEASGEVPAGQPLDSRHLTIVSTSGPHPGSFS